MRVAVIGSGGREHALLWKIRQSPLCTELIAVPGNPGMFDVLDRCETDMSVNDLVDTIRRNRIDFVIVGPEQPLADGLSDELDRLGILCFGPIQAAARLESSKVFAKQLMRSYGVPTAEFEVFTDFESVQNHISAHPRPNGRVVKADGLAAGKGAFVCRSDAEAMDVARRLLVDKELGTAGTRIVIEELLSGREASLHFFCDGERYVALPPAQDYKRAFDGDKGANTGGMGTFCPAAHVPSKTIREVERQVVEPVLNALRAMGTPYRGLLYVGIMLTETGPQVIEFNCRFGDPETQVMLPCLGYDALEPMLECAKGTLSPSKYAQTTSRCAVCVVLCAEGYPATYRKFVPLVPVESQADQLLFSAGTAMLNGSWVSSGGRVLNAVGLGDTMEIARNNAYKLADRAVVEGLRMRRDIALSEVL